MIRSLVALVFLVAGCGGNSPIPVADAGAPIDAGTARAPTDHPPLPSVVSHGGPVLTAMQIWTVVWSGDNTVGEEIDRLHAAMFADPYWSTVTSQYGVGVGTARGVIVIAAAPPATLDASEIDQLLPATAAAANLTLDGESVLAFVPPASTTVTAGALRGCVDFAGLHDETADGALYQLVLQCTNSSQPITYAGSHETIEVATDPHPSSAPGFFSDQIVFGEVSDLCEGLATTIPASDGTSFLVTRSWSQAIAATGTADPCVPAPPGIYFNAAVDPLVVTVARGNSSTALLEPYAFGDVGTIHWKVNAPSGITFTPASGTNQAGDTIVLSVSAASGTTAGPLPFLVQAASQSGGANAWNGQITVQ